MPLLSNIIAIMAFRIQSRHIALTYPQCTLDKETVYNFLLGLKNIERVLVAEEPHQDAGVHFHCYLRYRATPRTNITNPRHFDIHEFHPNVQACRNVEDWILYCLKEDPNPLMNFSITNKADVLKQVIQDCEIGLFNNDEIFAKAVTDEPSLLIHGPSLMGSIQILNKRSKVTIHEPRYDLNSFTLDLNSLCILFTWAANIIIMERGQRQGSVSLWLIGPSMVGKTALARSLGPHWYINQTWNINSISDEPRIYGILDDISWDYLRHYYKGLLGRQTNVTLTDKYCKKKEFSLGYPVIVCTNELPEFSDEERNWLRPNVHFYKIDDPIFPGSNPTSMYRMLI